MTDTSLIHCEDEPIRVPGAIQPHGWLMVLDRQSKLVAWSENSTQRQRTAALAVLKAHRLETLAQEPHATPLGTMTLDAEVWAAAAHRYDDRVLIEFEAPAAADEIAVYALARSFMPRLQATDTLDALAAVAVDQLKRMTGFGRCLLYRFDENGDGEVLAEQADDGYERYAGHHFPASDIPIQARALYTLNQFRLIPDAGYTPVPLAALPDTGPVDLSQCSLRSVSPVHLEYMRNMGTLASMSVSIVVDGKLWGLISCHDHAPRHMAAGRRLACEHLGRLVSLQVQAQQAGHAAAHRLELRRLTLQLVASLTDSDATLQRLMDDPPLMLRMARATGAAVVRDDKAWTIGDVPADPALHELAQHVAGVGKAVFHTEAIDRDLPALEMSHHGIAGCLAISISQVHTHVVMWFRPERVRTVTWAGDPRKEPLAADGRIHPRRSFASWVESIRGRSMAWSDEERVAVDELRQALIGIVLRRAEELAAVAAELGRANKELEAFSYTVSHDLRAPMRHITGYVDLVLDSEGERLGERSRRYLGNVKDAAAFAGELVDALLDFSRMGRTDLRRRPVAMGDLVHSLVGELDRADRTRTVEWVLASDLPVLHADPILLQVATRNLLANAVKYTRERSRARIEVRPARRGDLLGIEVQDNGVGFEMKYVAKLFGVFQRLHSAEEFEGTGIGLANVKRIVERHGGEVWAFSAGSGATFGFALPPTPGDPPTALDTSHA